MSTRTIVTLQVEVHDSQPYDDTWTAGKIHEHASKRALEQIGFLNRDDLRVVGTPKVKLVIAEGRQ